MHDAEVAAMTELIPRLHSALSGRFSEIVPSGYGGMAYVFRVVEASSGQVSALKVFRPTIASAVAEARFAQEIRIGLDSGHPGLVPIHESGTADGLPYFLMPFLAGGTLKERLKEQGARPFEEIVDVAEQVGAALQHVHEQGWVHRDVTPSNIMFDGDSIYLTDLGVARAIEQLGEDALTRTGISIGTPKYMSAEQAAGVRDLTVASDQYSFACVLYAMIVGEPPFTGPTSHVVMARQVNAIPPRPSIARPPLPGGMETALLKALSKTPVDRYPSVLEFVQAFCRAKNDPPAKGPRATSFRRRAIASAIATVLIVLSVVLWPPSLDANRVAVFAPDGDAGDAVQRDQIATYIGYVLEGTDPLEWVEGEDLIGARAVDGPGPTPKERRDAALEAGAAYFIDGSLMREAETVTVILRLKSSRTGEIVHRSAGEGPIGSSESKLGAVAMADLLGPIIEDGRVIDLGRLRERNPTAIAHFHQGEVQYRQARFDSALAHYAQAVQVDSLFALAAAKGLQAAHWQEDAEAGAALTGIATRQDSLLPLRYRPFVKGLLAYNDGRAEEALVHLDATAEGWPTWTEPVAAAGEVYYHLAPPSVSGLDSLAKSRFIRARELDPAFTPPLYHLAEMAIRSGEMDDARASVASLMEVDPDREIQDQLLIMMRCAEDGPEAVPWDSLTASVPGAVLSAAQALASAPHLRPCSLAATDGDRGLLQLDAWGSFLVRHAALSADGRSNDVIDLVQRAGSIGLPAHMMLVLNGVVSPELAQAADSVIDATSLSFADAGSPNLWIALQWASSRGDSVTVRRIASEFERRATHLSPQDALFAAIARGHLTAMTSPPEQTHVQLRELVPIANQQGLVWQPWAALAYERLIRAESLIALGAHDEARSILSDFGSHRAIVELVFLPMKRRLLASIS